MPFDVAKAIEKLSEAVNSGFHYAEKTKEVQSETELLKDRKRLQTAVNCAEKLIVMMFPYFNPLEAKEEREFNKLLKKFLENN